MKTVVIILTLLMSYFIEAQSDPTIIMNPNYNYNGFLNIKQRALWNKRPEAKKIFEGESVSGITVYHFEEDYFVKFTKGEFTQATRNFIRIPKGDRIYKKNGYYHLARCGNKIDEMYPALSTEIVKLSEETIEVPVSPIKNYYNENHTRIYKKPIIIKRPTVQSDWSNPVLSNSNSENIFVSNNDCIEGYKELDELQYMYDNGTKKRVIKQKLTRLMEAYPCLYGQKVFYKNRGLIIGGIAGLVLAADVIGNGKLDFFGLFSKKTKKLNTNPGYNPGRTIPIHNPGRKNPGYNPGRTIPIHNPGRKNPGYNPGRKNPGYNPGRN